MKKFKKFFLIFICFLLIFSTLQIPASAIAIEIIGGSYVAYAVLAAALAAAGYTIATNQISPEVFQGMLDSPNSELIKALIGGTTMYLSSKGSVYFNWTASEWATFTNWVNSFGFTTGVVQVPASSSAVVDNFNGTLVSSYLSGPIHTTNGIFSWEVGACTFYTYKDGKIHPRANLPGGFYLYVPNAGYSDQGSAYYLGGPCILNSNGTASLAIGIALNSQNHYASTLGEITHALVLQQEEIKIYYNNRVLNYSINNGILRLYNNYVSFTVNNTDAFNKLYTSIGEYISDVINTGQMVGSIGDDVVIPGTNTLDVGISAYPKNQVGVGEDSLPIDLDIGSTIDIPLDRYIDTPIDLSEDPVPIDFTPWQDKTIDTTPEDVIPDIKINPPRDVPANPDIPWADTESFPIDYPIDTDTPLLPDDPNPSEPPSGDDSNKLKLLPLILSKFPFCLPWDLQHAFKSLFVSGTPPVFDIPLRSVSAGVNENIHIDLTRFQSVANISRWFFSALWVVLLILITRKIVWK